MSESHYFHETGGSLPPNHPTYIERKADGELFDALKRGELCYVLNARQMGKSSLRARVMEKLQSEDVKCNYIDIGYLNTEDEMLWYTSFISELNNNFDILESREVDNWILKNKLITSNRLLKIFFKEILLKNLGENKIIIFLDEIDTLSSRKFKYGFLDFIRICYNERATYPEFNRIVFCLLGVVAPADLITDKQQSFNIGKNIELTGLEYSKAKESFAPGLTESVDNPEEVIRQIFDWTNGQPFLTQNLCQLVVTNAKNRTINIDILVKQNFLDNWESKSDGINTHLKYISDCLVSGDNDSVSLLVLLGKILDGKMIKYNSQDSEHVKLKLSGLITIESQGIYVFSKLYAQIFNKDWIKEKLDSMPKTWFPQGNLEEISYVSPPSQFVRFLYKLLDNKIILIVLCLIFIDLLSLSSAYYWFSSEAWTNSFNKTGKGGVIELIRGSILIVFTAYSFKDLFKEETKQILTQDNRWWMRSLIIIIGFLLTIYIISYHLYFAPIDLANNDSLKNNLSVGSYLWLGSYFVPYLCYLPYSLVNFIIVGTPLVSITMYGAIINISTNIKNIKIVDKSIKYVNDYIDTFSPISNTDKENVQEEMSDGFKQLSQKLLKDFTRYSIFFWGILFIFIFEARLGLSTLSEKARVLTFLDYAIGLVAIFFIVYHGIQNYRSTFKKTYTLLKRVDGDHETFNHQHNTKTFLIKVSIAMFSYIKKPYTYSLIIGAIALLLFIFSVPISK